MNESLIIIMEYPQKIAASKKEVHWMCLSNFNLLEKQLNKKVI